MVIRSPNIDHLVIATLVFIAVISNVRGQISVSTVIFDENTVLVIPKIGSAQPSRAILLENLPFIAKVLK
ncbi:hypothetical protein D3C73_1407000 [compost metagenome]